MTGSNQVYCKLSRPNFAFHIWNQKISRIVMNVNDFNLLYRNFHVARKFISCCFTSNCERSQRKSFPENSFLAETLKDIRDINEIFHRTIFYVVQHLLRDTCRMLHASHFKQHFLNSLISLRLLKKFSFLLCLHLHPPTAQRVSCERKIYFQCFFSVSC